MNNLTVPLILVCATVLLGACSSAPVANTARQPMSQAPVNSTAAMPRAALKAEMPAYLDPSSPLSRQRSVYFAFDDYSIKGEDAAVVQLHGKYLADHPAVAIKIEGSTDERGGTEYNLALGQKRAEAVARALVIYGVKPTQLETISWGKEKPKAAGHDEAAWSQNRRADLDYPTQ